MPICIKAWIDGLPRAVTDFDAPVSDEHEQRPRLGKRAYIEDNSSDIGIARVDKIRELGSIRDHFARTDTHEAAPKTDNDDDDNSTRLAPKRQRRSKGRTVSFSLPPVMPDTPPASGFEKRSRDDDQDQQMQSRFNDPDTTPKAKRRLARRSSRNFTTSALDLKCLEKPIHFPAKVDKTRLATDVQGLHKEIARIRNFLKVIPDTVRTDIENSEGCESPDHHFYEDHEPPLTAQSNHAQIRDIVQASMTSRQLQRHEHGWNNLVHARVLGLVFGSSPKNVNGPVMKPVSVRFEPMMAATIMAKWVPRIDLVPSSNPDGQNELASSVSGGGSLLSTSTSSDRQSGPPAPVPEELKHTRVGSKKVDYVLALDLALDRPLQRVLEHLMKREQSVGALVPAYVNQTMYEPVRESLIAVSIETKREWGTGDHPLHQLGIWTAAWHKRMHAMRLVRGLDLLNTDLNIAPSTSVEQQSRGSVPPPTLVSLPLIVARGERWEIYFACDHAPTQSIEIFGPFSLGTTDSLLEAYILLASLRSIGEWVEKVFYPAMETWFQCEGL